MVGSKAIGQYQQVDVETALINATPHRLIQMLYEGLLSNLSSLRGALSNQQNEMISIHIKKASNILMGLEEGLNFDKGGEIAINLRNLYDYMQRELIGLQVSADDQRVARLIHLVVEIKSAWDEIEPK